MLKGGFNYGISSSSLVLVHSCVQSTRKESLSVAKTLNITLLMAVNEKVQICVNQGIACEMRDR